MTSKSLRVAALAAVAIACGGKAESSTPEGDYQIDETGSALVSDSTTDADTNDDGSCKDGDHDHKGHGKHRFKVLDRLDGVRDHQITLAALPANVSARLLEKLHALDANGDGVVTKDELKARRDKDHEHGKKKKHGHHDDDGDDGRGDDDDHDADGEHENGDD